ncbi:MAG TPA: HipA family kinase [Bryobacterales bacterium]|nr:HipA family kinase [Bryobacterales bacterium]
MPVTAVQHFARMRGGAQAQLLLASDGHYYIVKFQNNPQHRRILANELLAEVLLRHLKLPTPPGEIVEVSEALIAATPALCMEAGGARVPCSPGLQFGSRYPGDPARVPVYDYVPDALLRQVVNADCFLGMVAFDKWVSNADGRQAIFFRDQIARWRCGQAPPGASEENPGSRKDERGFVAVMIDHGFAFTAHHWTFRDAPQIGIYPRPWVYERVTGYDSFEPWLGWITEFSLDVLDDAFKRIPPEWYDSDMPALESLLEQLYCRRARVPDLVRSAKRALRDPFPNWR